MSALDTTGVLSGLRVLVVEDEPILSLCLADSLESAGCVVAGEAGTVAAAMAMTQAGAFDVAILDLNLYGERTDAVAAAVVSGGRALVFSTGSTREEVPAEFRHWPVLHKPYRDEAIIAALCEVVQLAREGADARPKQRAAP